MEKERNAVWETVCIYLRKQSSVRPVSAHLRHKRLYFNFNTDHNRRLHFAYSLGAFLVPVLETQAERDVAPLIRTKQKFLDAY